MSERALVLAPRGRDASIASGLLREAGIEACPCTSLDNLISELDQGAAFVLMAEEALAAGDVAPLAAWLSDQEGWSDLPFVLLTPRGGGLERNPAAVRYLQLLGNVTFLERPFHPTTLISLARSALRGRRRQYEARSHLIELRESEAHYRLLFDSMDEGFCIIRLTDGPQGPFSDYIHVAANGAYERHTGLTDVIGKRARELVSESEANAWTAIYRDVLQTGESIRFARELRETKRYLELSAVRMEPQSRAEVAVIFQDVTERYLAERQLRELNDSLERRVVEIVAEREAAAAKLQEVRKLETLGQLTGGVAHDVNNLLTPITGTLDLLSRRIGNSDERVGRLIDGALQSAERARILVSRLLGFARRQALETRPINVDAIVDGMGDLIKSSVGAAVELQIRADADVPPAMADPNQLELALLNLSVNARDAMPEGGLLTVSTEHILVGSRGRADLKPGAYVRLSVVDTGFGMDAETLSRAVEPFYSTKEVGKGTGLGLSMVHGLAAQLGGAFALTSEPGKGTRADLYLPATSDDVTLPLRHEPQAIPQLCALRILLVDDEDLVRAGTAEMLRDMGHQVHEAPGGGQALAMLAQGLCVDVIVTDYMMPRMNGAEFSQRAAAAGHHHPVLVVTGYAGGELSLGLPQLAKPYRQVDLAKALQKVVGERGTAAATVAVHRA